MVTVKELECLSLATAFHKSYSPLQEDTDLLKCCIGMVNHWTLTLYAKINGFF